MNPLILAILDIALGIAKNETSGKVSNIIGQAQALEQLASAVNERHKELTGKPLDLSLLTYEPPIV